MNSSCSMGTFDQGPSNIPWTIHKSNLFFQTTVSRAFCFQNRAKPSLCFSKLSNFWLFSVDFFKEYNFLAEKTHFYWCLQDSRFLKTLEISSFFVFLRLVVFLDHRVSQAKPSFFARYGKPSRAFWKAWSGEPSFLPKSSSQNWAKQSSSSDPTLLLIHLELLASLYSISNYGGLPWSYKFAWLTISAKKKFFMC